MNDFEKYFEANKAIWEEKTTHHEKSSFYDVPSFLAGQSSLNEIELEFLRDISGKKILHLQCHFGLDSLSMARMGAQVTGLDLSEKSIELAKKLNEQCQLNVQFIQCNVYDALDHLDEKFDLIFTSYGALVWLPDLELWTEIVNKLLKPDGECLIVEFHPYIYTFDFPKTDIKFSYKNTGLPYSESSANSYTDNSDHREMREYFWSHSIEEVMTGFIKRKYQFLNFKEYYYSPYNCFGNSVESQVGKWVFGGFNVDIPHVYALHVKKS